MTHDPRLILLDPRDNVFVARVRLKAGETVETGSGSAPSTATSRSPTRSLDAPSRPARRS